MNLYLFTDVVKNAQSKTAEGWSTYQQFNCAHCHMKQTMPDADVFHKKGRCTECGQITDIERDGCNFMATFDRGRKCLTNLGDKNES
jgi:hypothetical protein